MTITAQHFVKYLPGALGIFAVKMYRPVLYPKRWCPWG